MSKEIQLTRDKVAIVDDADFDWLNQWKWHALTNGYTWYAMRAERHNGKQKAFLMHREILKPSDDVEIDHKDYDGLNNCRYNLRIATSSENQHHQRPQKRGKSLFKGVSWCQRLSKWQSRIQMEKRPIWLGLFDSEIDAPHAYDRAALKYFGEFAYLNFPEEDLPIAI